MIHSIQQYIWKSLILAVLIFGGGINASAQLSITCPDDINVINDPGQCSAVVTYTPPTGTGSGTGITTTLIAGLPSGSAFEVGTTEIIYKVSNNEGDEATCSFFVNVTDSEIPALECPDNIIVNIDPGACTAQVFFDIPDATDNCGIYSVFQIAGLSSGSNFPIGLNLVDIQAVDINGNSAFCRFKITVNDNQLPDLTCPSDMEIPVYTSCDSVITYTPPTGSDACSGVSTVLTSGIGSGGVFPMGSTTETYTATDANGNSVSCSFVVTLYDAGLPELQCPSDITVNLPPDECEVVVNFPPPTVTDNCPDVEVLQTVGPASGSVFQAGTTTIEYAALDNAGSSTCSFQIHVIENVAPQITCPGPITASATPGQCGAVVEYDLPAGTDNCAGVTTALSSGIGPGNFFPVGVSTETYTATDASGNTTSCSFTVEVIDETPPIFACPADVVMGTEIGECGAQVNFPLPAASDNCSVTSILQTAGPTSGSFFPVGSTSVEFTAVDDAGNESICTFSVIVNDTEQPQILCPTDIDMIIPDGNCSMEVTYPAPQITDNCTNGAPLNYTVISGPASGDILTAGNYTVELQATDAQGNSSTCTFSINLTETTTPQFTCPPDVTINTAAGECGSVYSFDLPVAQDDCSPVTVTQTGGPVSGTWFPAGSTTLEFEATDLYGNSTTCSYTVTVNDGVAPVITCPDDITLSAADGTCEATVNYPTPVATDACTGTTLNLVAGLPSGDVFPVGTTTVTYEAVDEAGNTAQCTFTVTVTDDENPLINCPADISKTINNGDCSTEVFYAMPTASDNCGINSVTQINGLPSGSNFPLGENVVVFVATDNSGNNDTCSFKIIVSESVAPQLECPADINVSTDPGACSAVVNYTPPAGTDNCTEVLTELTAGLGTGAEFPVGTTTETYTATDLNGNTTTCSFTVTVSDTEAPLINCPDDLEVSTDAGACSAIVSFDTPTASDNCGAPVTIVQSGGPASGSAFPLGNTSVEFTATDAEGNVSVCSFTVLVVDDIAPEIVCPADIVFTAPSGDCGMAVNYSTPTASDNCSVPALTIIEGYASGSIFPVGVTTVTWMAQDDAGNQSQCSFSVTITENIAPEITCPDDITTDNDPGVCGAVINYTPPMGTDNCSGATTNLIAGPAPGELFPVGVTDVTWEVTDVSGNTATCTFQVTVTDNEAPEFICSGDQTLSVDDGLCGRTFTFDTPIAQDNCSENLVVTQTSGPVSGTILPLGTTTFSFSATDDAGNTAICTYAITVEDTNAPVFENCPGDLTFYTGNDACSALISYDSPQVTDNCDFTLTQNSGPLSNTEQTPGEYPIEFIAEDISGNASTCAFTITVLDTIAPVFQCPDTLITCSSTPSFDLPAATDNCQIAEVTQTSGPESGSVFPTGISTVTFTATDVNGNSSVCALVVHVLQNAPQPDLGDDRNICDSTHTMLSGSNPDETHISWTQISGNGTILDPNEQNTEVENLSEGANTFVYTLDPMNGCEVKSDTLTIYVEPGVLVDAGDDRYIPEGSSVNLFATVSPPGGVFQWEPGAGLSCQDCQNPIGRPAETITWLVAYTSPMGCTVTDSITVRVAPAFPNTITPDGDGVNDVWNIPGIKSFPNAVVLIYNRWGNEVFRSRGYTDPWDGKYKGDELPAGSYYYMIDYKTPGKDNQNGTVNIIR